MRATLKWPDDADGELVLTGGRRDVTCGPGDSVKVEIDPNATYGLSWRPTHGGPGGRDPVPVDDTAQG